MFFRGKLCFRSLLDQLRVSHGPFCFPMSESLIRRRIKFAECAPVLGRIMPLLGYQSDLGLWRGFVWVNPAGTCRVGSVGLELGVLNSCARLLLAQMDGQKLQGHRQEPWHLLRSPSRTWKERATPLPKEPPTLQVERTGSKQAFSQAWLNRKKSIEHTLDIRCSMQILCGFYFLQLFHLELLWCISVQAAQETVQQVAESSKEAANTGKGQICQAEIRNTVSEKLGDRTVHCPQCYCERLLKSLSHIYGCILAPEISVKT